MLFKVSEDWKQLLAADDEAKLNEILKKIAKYQGAYRNAPDIKTAQLWAAILELKKENIALQNRLRKMEDIFGGIKERIKKQEEEEKELLESLEKF